MDKQMLKTEGRSIAVRCKPGIQWSVESKGICLFDPEKNEARMVAYPEAAVWELTQRGYSFEKTVKLLGAITSNEEEKARIVLMKTLQDWIEKGILCVEATHG